MTVKQQITGVLRSRKFWAALLSVVASLVTYSYGKIDAQTLVLAIVGAASAYCLGTGLEGPRVPPQARGEDQSELPPGRPTGRGAPGG